MRFEALRAKAGAKLLDIIKPGWFAKLDLDKLDLSDCKTCVLGQAFGSFTAGCEKVFAVGVDVPYTHWGAIEAGPVKEHMYKQARRFGFELPGHQYTRYTTLTSAWRAEIRRRQKRSANG